MRRFKLQLCLVKPPKKRSEVDKKTLIEVGNIAASVYAPGITEVLKYKIWEMEPNEKDGYHIVAPKLWALQFEKEYANEPEVILERKLREFADKKNTKTLFIMEGKVLVYYTVVDELITTGGRAEKTSIDAKYAVIATEYLKQEWEGIVVHELGHLFGLSHCENKCIMNKEPYKNQIMLLCKKHKRELEENLN